MWKTVVALALLVGIAHAAPPKPSGALKAYKGPEGELVALVEVNAGKEMLVFYEGVSHVYLFEDLGRGTKNVYYSKKRGSKTERHYVLTARDNHWTFHDPAKPTTDLEITYSESDSKSLKLDDLVAAYKP